MLKYHPVGRVHDLISDVDLSIAPPSVDESVDAVLWLKTKVFLGKKQNYTERTRSGRLSNRQVEALASIGIEASAGKYYQQGLVSTQTHSGVVDVVHIHNHLQYQQAHLLANPNSEKAQDAKSLLRGIALCIRAELALATMRRTVTFDLVRRERTVQLAQLGTLLLPLGFVSSLKQPVYFAETIAPKIGRLVQINLS